GVLPAIAMHLVEVLGLQVVRLELLVADRPCGRDASVVPELAEVLLPEPEQRRAIELRVPAHGVVGVRMERVSLPVVPDLLRLVPALDVDPSRVPVGLLPRDVVAPLQKENALPGGRKSMGQSAASCPGPDDDDVEAVHGSNLPKGIEPRAQRCSAARGRRSGRGSSAFRAKKSQSSEALPAPATRSQRKPAR